MIQEEVNVGLPAERARSAALQALENSGLALSGVRQDGDLIVATISASLRSFGETVTIQVESVQPTSSVVRVRSASAALIDWGKNRENVTRILGALRRQGADR